MPAPGMVEVPMLVTIPGIDIVAAGEWNLSTGPATFTPEDLENAVAAADCPAIGNPVIKLGHLDPRFDGEPALGKVTNLALSTGGNKITGDLAGMPGWLAVIAESAYPQRSIEGWWDLRCQIGHSHPFVISAVSLLGVAPPGVGVLGGLDQIAALYGVAAEAASPGRPWRFTQAGEGGPMPGSAHAAGVTTEDVRRAYYGSGVPMSMWITEMQMDPPQLIVADDANDKVFRIPFTIKNGEVTFADAVEVEVVYSDVKAMAALRGAGLATVFASAEDSRRLVMAWDGGAMVKNLGDDPSQSALNKCFALPGDSKSASKLPHHTVSTDGTVGGPDLGGCQAAIGAINGAHGGLTGVSAADKKKAYNHLAAHVRDLGGEPAEFAGSAPPPEGEPEGEPDASGAAPEVSDKGTHRAWTGTHAHAHSAGGSQGSDQTHDHEHSHQGDASHAHAHASGGGQNRKGAPHVDFTDDMLARIRKRLGLADDAELTPEQVTAAIDQDPPQVAASALPPNVMAVDRQAWQEMTERAKSGEEALRRIRTAERDQVIGEAVRAGKFAVAAADAYRRLWDTNPEGTRAVIASMARNVVPTADIGTAGGDLDDQADADYRALYGNEPARA